MRARVDGIGGALLGCPCGPGGQLGLWRRNLRLRLRIGDHLREGR